MRVCSACRTPKPFDQFYLNTQGKAYGLCKPCNSAKGKEWRRANPDRKKEMDRAWRQANLEKKKAANREWYWRNKVELTKYHQIQYAKNRDARLAQVKQWQAANPEKVRLRVYRRYLRERNAPGGPFDESRADYQARIAFYGGLCAYCRRKAEALDHSIPLSKGGSNFASNIKPICTKCNRNKQAKRPSEWKFRWYLEEESK